MNLKDVMDILEVMLKFPKLNTFTKQEREAINIAIRELEKLTIETSKEITIKIDENGETHLSGKGKLTKKEIEHISWILSQMMIDSKTDAQHGFVPV